MAEKLHNHESKSSSEEVEKTPDLKTIERAAEKREHEAEALKVQELDEDDERVPSDSEANIQAALAEPEDRAPVYPPDKALKALALRNYLKSIRGQLNGREKLLSKVVHQPTVNNISEVAGKTLIRPSGILTGGILTTIGSIIYYIEVKQTGYRYNFLIALMLFAGGFIIGIVLEYIFSLMTKKVKE